jgi:aspartate-semialdehyde dehydrogenase
MTGDTAKIRAKIRVGVLGASGYTGADLIRLLAGHPRAEIVLMTANAQAGKPLSAVFPHLGGLDLPDLIRVEEADWGAVDVAFCCPMPSGMATSTARRACRRRRSTASPNTTARRSAPRAWSPVRAVIRRPPCYCCCRWWPRA